MKGKRNLKQLKIAYTFTTNELIMLIDILHYFDDKFIIENEEEKTLFNNLSNDLSEAYTIRKEEFKK